MAHFDAEDERFGHQLPEPFRNVVHHNDSWRESLFFIMHKRNEPGDVLILTLAHFPAHNEMDSLQLGRVGNSPVMARHARPTAADPNNWNVGPVSIDVVEPKRQFICSHVNLTRLLLNSTLRSPHELPHINCDVER